MHALKTMLQILLLLLIIPWLFLFSAGGHKALVKYRKANSPACHYMVICSIALLGLYALFALGNEWLEWGFLSHDTISVVLYALVIWLIANEAVYWLVKKSAIGKIA